MGLVGFLLFFVKYCVDVLAWPLLALAYPLCASARAIETNSVLDTQKLNTYWVVFSLILLLEHTLSLLEWFPFWPYLRLIIVCFLEIPHFDGAFYVYEQIMCSLFSMDFQSIINWFTIKPKESSSIEEEKILAEVEKYVRENGTEALEKIIAPKSGSSKNIEVRDIQALSVSSTDNGRVNQRNSKEPHEARKDIKPVVEVIEKNQVKETTQPNSKEPRDARKDIKAVVEVIEKNQVKETTQVNRGEPQLTQTKNRTALPTETREKVSEVQAGRELPETPVSRIVQKEWTCAICQVTTESEADFISHLTDKKHKGIMNEAANAKNQPVFPEVAPSYSPEKYAHPAEEDPGKSSNDQTVFPKPNSKEPHEARKDIKAVVEVIEKNQVKETTQANRVEPQTKNITALPTETREKVSEVQAGRELPQTPVSRIVQKEWTCAICQVTTQSEVDLISHLGGKKHKGIMNEATNAKNQPFFPKVAPSYSPEIYAHPAKEDPGKSSNDQTVFPKVVFSPKISGQFTAVPLPGIIFNASSNRWEPGVITSEKLQGKEKNAVPAASTSKSNERKQETKTSLSNSERKQKSGIKHEEKGHGKKAMKQKTGTVGVKDLSLWCRVCNIWCPSKVHMKAHLRGKKHLNEVQLLAEK